MTPISAEVIQKGERLALCCDIRDYKSGRFEMLPISTAWIGSLSLVNEGHVKFGADLNSIILEPLSLCYGSCLKRANDILSKNRFSGPNSVINGEDLKPAGIFLRSWYSSRRIRAATILAKMIGFVRGMIDWVRCFHYFSNFVKAIYLSIIVEQTHADKIICSFRRRLPCRLDAC